MCHASHVETQAEVTCRANISQSTERNNKLFSVESLYIWLGKSPVNLEFVGQTFKNLEIGMQSP